MSDKPGLSEFTDWLIEGPAGKWPNQFSDDQLNKDQLAVVQRNANLLQNRSDWEKKVNTFENRLKAQYLDEDVRDEIRKRYTIRFDHHKFETQNKVYDFRNYHFPCAVNFSHAIFGDGTVNFDGSTFEEGYVSFRSVTFIGGDISFIKTAFGKGDVSFYDTIFGSGVLSFYDCNFGDGNIFFFPKELNDTSVSFLDAKVAGNLFLRANFPETVIFNRIVVKGTVQFSDCKFANVPDLSDAKFDRPPEVARMEVPAPDLDGRRFLFRICEDKEAVSKYRKLKAMAIDAHDHDMDGKFFAYEMMAKRGTETVGFFALFFNSLYGFLGGYGQSFTKPMKGLFASWILFGIVYFGLASSVLPLSDRFLFAAEYSARSAIPLLNSLFRFSISPSDTYVSAFEQRYSALEDALGNIDWFTYLAIIQQFIGLVLLFLLLLALRNTFRLK
jgi:hypothetical protein